jgi:nucleotide-binding universal stress UspA family protein
MSDTRPILFATDGSPSATEAQQEAFELARTLDAPLLVVSVTHSVLPAIGYVGYGYSDVVAELSGAEHPHRAAARHHRRRGLCG